jgi:serine phosphatase RsbU (regulator of sigma subunit)/DNA-binding response OmpR family regulator
MALTPDIPSPTTVLVLDDRPESRYLVTTWLSRAGYEVVEASSGAEALAAVRRGDIDVALLDVNLPDMSGFEVCESIRADVVSGAMPVIHLSATAVASADRSEGLLRGADAFLVEPIDPRVLLATITALIRRADMRRRVRVTTERLRTLNQVTADVHAASSDRQLFAAVIEGATRLAGAPAILVLRRAERALAVVVGVDGELVTTEVPPSRLDEVLSPAVTGATSLTTAVPEVVAETLVGAAFVDETGEPVGAILVPADVEGASDEIVALLAQLSIAISLARANMRALDVEHRIAMELQRSLLPQAPPTSEHVTIGFRYLASSTEAEVGGDFYEAVALDATHFGVAIGDVVGHSLHAATVMGELRHALRAYAIDGYGPLEIVERLDRLITRFHPMMMTTLVYGVVDVVAGEFRFCNAGHLPPLVMRPGGASSYVTAHGSLLGFGGPHRPPVAVPFGRGDRLVLVTDGLIETRAESIDVGLRRLQHAVEASRDEGVDGAIEHIIRAVGPPTSPTDDIAIVVVDGMTGPTSS